MVIVGVDAHKRTHALVAVDEVGRKLGARTVAATSEGHLEALEWSSGGRGGTSRWKTAATVTRRLESDVLVAGQAVVRVPLPCLLDH